MFVFHFTTFLVNKTEIKFMFLVPVVSDEHIMRDSM